MENRRMKLALKYVLPFTGKRKSDRIKTVLELTAVVLAIVLSTALSFVGCKGAVTPTRDTTWIRLTPITLDEVDGVRTATLLLDFSESIPALDDRGASLEQLFTFGYTGRDSESAKDMRPVKITRSATGIYTLTVEKVPESGIVSVHIKVDSVTPDARRWTVAGPYVPETDITPALLDFRFEKSKNPALTADEVLGSIDQKQGNVVVVVPLGADRSALTPTVTTNQGNSYTPSDGAINFTEGVRYHVEAAQEDAQKDYTVMVFPQTDASASIYSFAFTSEKNPPLGDSVFGVINEGDRTIAVTVPEGTDRGALVPRIIHSGADIAPKSLEATDFTGPVEYTVTALNDTVVRYVVSVNVGTWNGEGDMAPDPNATLYGITVASLTDGTIEPSTTQAPAGERIALTITPKDATYRLKSGSLHYGGIGISGTAFIMPAFDVEITGEFESVSASEAPPDPVETPPEATLYDINVAPGIEHGSIVPGKRGTQVAAAGELISLTITPDADYQLKSGSLKYNGVPLPDTSTAFTMPGYNVTLTAEFEPIPVRVTGVTLTSATMETGMKQRIYDYDGPYNSEQLVATVLPENATNKAVIWSASDNSQYITLTQDGLVTVVRGAGRRDITVTVTTVDGSFFTTCLVKIYAQ